MNRRSINAFYSFLLPLCLLFIMAGLAYAQDEYLLKHPREMNFPPLSFVPPKAERVLLSNGMVLYLLEDPELPLIQFSALIRTGSIYDPPHQNGLAKLTATLLRTGGTSDQTPQAINEELEFMAAELDFSMGRESGGASLSVQKKDFPRALSIFANLLMKPAFDLLQLDLAKKKKIEAIRRSNDNPEEIAYREFRRVLYEGNPRGQVPTIESIQSIQRADLLAFHRKFYKPNNMILGISGDFKKEEMIASLEGVFRSWERSLIELPFIPIPSPRNKKLIYHAKKDLPQSTILMGHLSIPLDHPDYIPFKVLNFILGGGGFNSRLTQEIRSNQGLAYSVGSFYQGRVGYGVFGAFCQTKSATTHKVISLLYQMAEEIKNKNRPTPGELDWAQKTLVNQFIFSFTSSASIISQQIQLEYDGLPEDYLEKYQDRVAAVTLKDLERVAENHLHPEKSLLMVVGKEEDFDKPLSSFGLVNRIELKKFN
ncbi:MAG: pitrilysin family protein [Thermodesulfobacteriota bacterium]|nr:pitrilysin family protein [Thermodesulfobacteriota bacterium]